MVFFATYATYVTIKLTLLIPAKIYRGISLYCVWHRLLTVIVFCVGRVPFLFWSDTVSQTMILEPPALGDVWDFSKKVHFHANCVTFRTCCLEPFQKTKLLGYGNHLGFNRIFLNLFEQNLPINPVSHTLQKVFQFFNKTRIDFLAVFHPIKVVAGWFQDSFHFVYSAHTFQYLPDIEAGGNLYASIVLLVIFFVLPYISMVSKCNYIFIHQVALVRRSEEPFGLRVKPPPVYYTRWRLHSVHFYCWTSSKEDVHANSNTL